MFIVYPRPHTPVPGGEGHWLHISISPLGTTTSRSTPLVLILESSSLCISLSHPPWKFTVYFFLDMPLFQNLDVSLILCISCYMVWWEHPYLLVSVMCVCVFSWYPDQYACPNYDAMWAITDLLLYSGSNLGQWPIPP